MERGIIIIGGCRMGKKAIHEAAARAMKTECGVNLVIHHLSSCTNIRFNEVEESVKRIQDTFSFSGIVAGNMKDSLEDFIEAMKNFKPKESFDPQPSKFISKPKNNFRIR